MQTELVHGCFSIPLGPGCEPVAANRYDISGRHLEAVSHLGVLLPSTTLFGRCKVVAPNPNRIVSYRKNEGTFKASNCQLFFREK